jgi:hypothetical protein
MPFDQKRFLPPESKEFSTDLDYARKNILELIENGQKGLENMIDIADQSQHPRAYEVLSTYLKTLADLNKSLLDVSEKKKNQKEEGKQVDQKGNITNNLFVGSTAEFQKMISSIIEGKKNE